MHDVIAPIPRTPLHARVEVGKLLAVPIDVLSVVVYTILIQLVLQILQEKGMGHHHVAPELCAFCEHTLRPDALDFVLQVHSPTYLAELMAAAQLI